MGKDWQVLIIDNRQIKLIAINKLIDHNRTRTKRKINTGAIKTEPALKARNIITVGEAHGYYAEIQLIALKGRNIYRCQKDTALSGLMFAAICHFRGLHPRLLIFRHFVADC